MTKHASATFIIIDWGTTNRRAYLVDQAGKILDSREDGLGIRRCAPEEFKPAFEDIIQGWRESGGSRPTVFMSGMIGSRQGWAEAPYAPCPAGRDALLDHIMAVPGVDDAWIIPGMALDPAGARRDVMRGEEIQVFGALDIIGRDTATLCLPGTHSKWVRAENGVLTNFSTAMTGEVYQVMSEHSILGALMDGQAPHDADAFHRGLETSRKSGGLLSHLFSLRADGLFGVTGEAAQASFLSGLLIGHEIHGVLPDFDPGGEPVYLVGSSALAGLYADALTRAGVPHHSIDDKATTIRGHLSLLAAREMRTSRESEQ